jgi:putative ABC transport system permease protein
MAMAVSSSLDSVVQDVRYAFRGLQRSPGFAAVAVIALALGIGVNNTLFTIVNAICIRGLPIDRPDRVMYLATRDQRERDAGLSYRDLEDMRSAVRAFTGIAAFAAAPMVIGDEGRAPDRVLGTYISANAFHMIGEQPIVGRDFRSDDDRPGAPAVVILGYGVWTNRYGADSTIVGRTIRMNGAPSTVVGVMPAGFKFPNNADVWQPLALMPGLQSQRRDTRALGAFGRLHDQATIGEARAELSAIGSRLSMDFPDTNTGIRPTVVPINQRYNGRITDPVWIAFMVVGGLVVLIACANVANLLLMRSARRSREIAVRASLGATRRRIVRQLLVESTVLATLGGLVGFGFSLVGVRLFASLIPENGLPYWVRLTVDERVFAVLVAVCLGTVVVFGLAPALHVSKTDVNQVLKDGGRMSAGFRVRRWTTAFLTLEFALTVVLLAALVMGVRVGRAAQRSDVRIDTTRLMTMWLTLPNQSYGTSDQRLAFYQRLRERVDAISPITSATMATALPFGGAVARQLAIDGRPPAARDTPPTVWTLTIAPRYFETFGLSIVRGRDFDETDGTAARESAIVNQRFVDVHFQGEDPIGRRIRLTSQNAPGETEPWLTIVGTSPTVRQRTFPDPDPVVYLPFRQAPPSTAALVLRASDPSAVAKLLREEVRALDPGLPLYRVMTMEQFAREAGWNGRVSARLLDSIASIALLLSAVGLYAVTASAVVQRTQEIGVRMALGARPAQIVWLVLRRAMAQVGIGFVVGAGCAWVWGRLFGPAVARREIPTMTDPWTLAGVAALLTVVALLACVLPARRATRLDPVAALRYD